jgi:hypothetical protein
MKRRITWVAAVGFLSGLMLVAVPLHESRSGIVAKVHAQENRDDKKPKSCTVASLDGTFGLYRQGTTGVGTASPNALAAVGIIVLANGSIVSGHQTTSRNGVFIDSVFGGGTYEVDPDCTGRLFSANGTLVGRFSIVDDGKEVFLLSMTPSNAVTEVWKKVGTQEQWR